MQELSAWLNTDQASFQSCASTGTIYEVATKGYDDVNLEERIPAWLADLESSELQVLCARGVRRYRDIFSKKRLDGLRVSHDMLRPFGLKDVVTKLWRCPQGVTGVTIARQDELRQSDLETFANLLPSLRIADHYVWSMAGQPADGIGDDFADYALSIGLNTRQAHVADLAIRGFKNPEIASILRISPNTVRNYLHEVFRKAQVSTRAELAYVSKTASKSAPTRSPDWAATLERCLENEILQRQ